MSILNSIPSYTPPPGRPIGEWGTVDEGAAQQLQDRLDALINELGLVGLQVGLKRPDGPIWTGAGGTIDLRRRVPLTPHHVMRIASTTKLFTSVMVLRLVEDGRIRLEDTIDRWLPDFPRAARITVAMLLSHTSGIGHPPFTLKVKLRLLFSNTVFTLDELVELAARTPSYDEPGQSHQYSNANHHLLGAIARSVGNRPIGDLIESAIFSRLGLVHTALLPDHPPPANLVSGWDNVYTPSLRPFELKPTNVMLASHASTSGGMVSTAGELLAFVDGLFAKKLISGSLLARMTAIEPCSEPAFHHTGYGTGIFRIGIDGQDYLGHLGLFVGSQALVLYLPQSGGALSVVGNLSQSRVFDVASHFAPVIQGNAL